jgi:glycosyltransferase involved in cell wall biosynthesis
MKIAIFSDNFYPETSGISDSIITLAKELAKDGHKIRFYAPKYSKKNFAIVDLKPNEIDLGKNISVKRMSSLPYPSSPTQQARIVIPAPWRWLDVKKFKPDIIYSQLFFGVGLEALIAAKLLKVPFIGTSHTPMNEFMNYSPVKSKKITGLMLKYVNWYYAQCDFVTTPSHAIINEMKEVGFEKDAHVISNPIDLVHFNKPTEEKRQELKEKYGLSNFTVISTGRLAPEKHLDDIIKAVHIAKKKYSRN